jgi:hypothetical protein
VWEVKLDPPAEPVKLSPASSVLPIAVGISDDIVLPPAPSPYVAIRRFVSGKPKLELWDWTKGRRTAEIYNFSEGTHNLTFHPEGTFVGAHAFSSGGGRLRQWSFKSGKMEELAWTGSKDDIPSYSQLLSQERVLVTMSSSKAIVLDAQGKEVWSSEVPIRPEEASCTSPTGRYLALVVEENNAQRLWVVDLTAKQVAGNLPLPAVRQRYAFRQAKGLAFSPDGSRLAALFEESSTPRLVVWDVSTGQVAVDRSYVGERLDSIYRGQRVEWADDGGLMLSGGLLLRATGDVEGHIAEGRVGERQPRRLVDGRRILMVKDKKLKVHPLEVTK